ncbi:LysM peptidoglycan-binding domain-containing protein [Desulfitobacterium sp. AusDCA]|uniref:LysM peptidoglycan-binding domain-containing protein n=1 Tax=Desulfitobacterium sp. AusDCA TaxID=3240383 RepID=UPI003DA70690
MPEYVIQRGDDFYRLAQRFGGNCEDWQLANPGINPVTLQIGQKVVLPPILNSKAREQYAELTTGEGKEFAGDHMDDVEMEIEGVRFRIKRIGESKIPHEIHLIVPRTEIRKIQPQGEQGPCEVQIMLSNVDIVHSPRLMSEGGGTKAASAAPVTTSTSGGTSAMPKPPQPGPSEVSGTAAQGGLYGAQSEQSPLARTQELGSDIRTGRPIVFRK